MADPDDVIASDPADVATAEGPFLPPPRRGIPRWVRIVTVPVLAVALGGSIIHTTYYSLGPGPATDVLSYIKVTGGKTYPSKGKLLLTTASVSDRALTIWDLVWTWIDPNLTTIKREQLIPAGVSDEEQDAINLRDMEESKADAEVAAFRALGKTVTVLPGARIFTVIPRSAAEDKLQAHDLITSVDRVRVRTPEAAVVELQKHRIGDAVRIGFTRGTKTMTVTLKTRPGLSDPKKPAIGVTLGRAFKLPEEIDIDTREIGGPSGGLVFALSIVDALSPEDLTRGHIVAVTGTISLRGGRAVVGAIGAIEEKIRGAKAVHADIFIVPKDQNEATIAARLAPKGMKIIGVATLDEAIAALRGLRPA